MNWLLESGSVITSQHVCILYISQPCIRNPTQRISLLLIIYIKELVEYYACFIAENKPSITKQEFHAVGVLAINRFATWYVVHDASWHAEVYRLPSLAVSPSPRLWMAWRGASG